MVVGFPLLCLLLWEVRLKTILRFCIVLSLPLWFPLGFLLRSFHLSVRLVAVRWVVCVTLFLTEGLLCPRHSD